MIAGDEAAFAALVERHRRPLHVHCYRMLASFEEAEDAVQETLLRAWRGRASLDDGSLLRAWLYRIATNVCLDMLRRSSRRAATRASFAEAPWLQPYPDRLLDEVAPGEDEPDTVAVERSSRRPPSPRRAAAAPTSGSAGRASPPGPGARTNRPRGRRLQRRSLGTEGP